MAKRGYLIASEFRASLVAARLALAFLTLAGAGCRVAQKTAQMPVNMVASVVPGSSTPEPLDPAIIQTEVLRYADDFCSRTATGLDEYARRINTPEGRSQALKWKLAINSSVIDIATGENPTANLVDFLALSSLTRAFLEQRATNSQPAGAFNSWLNHSRTLETNAWKIAGKVITPQQQKEFRGEIARWVTENTDEGASFFARPQALASDFRQGGQKDSRPGSIYSLVGLDPTAGLDPAVREVTRTRLFAERALFALERMPFLVRWQTELLTIDLLRNPQLTNALFSADRLTRAAESATQTAALLPDRITAERKAIVEALDANAEKMRLLAQEIHATLGAGEKMSDSLNTTLTTFDGLMKRFGVGEPSAKPPDTNAAPFNILDYGRTAEQIGAMAQHLDSLIKDSSGTLESPALEKRMTELRGNARAEAKSVLNHAFLLAAGLILLTFVCAVTFRRLVPRRG